jgi:hypothetical protein
MTRHQRILFQNWCRSILEIRSSLSKEKVQSIVTLLAVRRSLTTDLKRRDLLLAKMEFLADHFDGVVFIPNPQKVLEHYHPLP